MLRTGGQTKRAFKPLAPRKQTLRLGDDTWIRLRLHPLGNNNGVKQVAHPSTLRKRPPNRFIRMPEPRKGDAAKKSASVPLRFFFLSHSLAATITAVVRPLRVIGWGPSDSALSITSLNRALAWATVHVGELMNLPSSAFRAFSHDGHFCPGRTHPSWFPSRQTRISARRKASAQTRASRWCSPLCCVSGIHVGSSEPLRFFSIRRLPVPQAACS